MTQEVAYYKYYLLGETVPIRVSFNGAGHMFNAEVPDKTQGTIRSNPTYLTRVCFSDEVAQITEDQFLQLSSHLLPK